jgi:hypothetical protein
LPQRQPSQEPLVGLALPTNVVQIALGISILGIVGVMMMAKKIEFPK